MHLIDIYNQYCEDRRGGQAFSLLSALAQRGCITINHSLHRSKYRVELFIKDTYITSEILNNILAFIEIYTSIICERLNYLNYDHCPLLDYFIRQISYIPTDSNIFDSQGALVGKSIDIQKAIDLLRKAKFRRLMQKIESRSLPFFRKLGVDISFQYCRSTDMLQLTEGEGAVYTRKCDILQSYLSKVQIPNSYRIQQLEQLKIHNSRCTISGTYLLFASDSLVDIASSDVYVCILDASVLAEYLNYFCTASARIQGYPCLSDVNVLPALNFSQTLSTFLNTRELKMSLQEKPYVRMSVSVPESIISKVYDFLKKESPAGKPENLHIILCKSPLEHPVFPDIINTTYSAPKFILRHCKILWLTQISVINLETATPGIVRVGEKESAIEETLLYGKVMSKYTPTVPYAEYIQNLGDRIMNFIEQTDPGSLKKSFVSVRRVEFKNQNTSNTQRQQNSALEEWGFARDLNISLLHNELE